VFTVAYCCLLLLFLSLWLGSERFLNTYVLTGMATVAVKLLLGLVALLLTVGVRKGIHFESIMVAFSRFPNPLFNFSLVFTRCVL